MPFIYFLKKRPPIEVSKGTKLMEALLAHGIPVASSCKGEAVCGKCWLYINQGVANLSAMNSDEVRLQQTHSTPAEARISCQVEVLGDITVDAPYW